MKPSFREILRVLNKHEVEYLVVGGVAAVIHGAPMTTFDLDALIRVSSANAQKILKALDELDARFREHAETIRPSERDLTAGGHLLLMTNAGPLDVLGFAGHGHTYEDLVSSSDTVDTSAGEVQVVDLETLISLKRELGRAKDVAAVELLEEVDRKRKV